METPKKIYQFWNLQFYIKNWDLFIRKIDEKEFKKIDKKTMIEACNHYKWYWKIYQPMTVNVYRAWKNWNKNQYNWLLIDFIS